MAFICHVIPPSFMTLTFSKAVISENVSLCIYVMLSHDEIDVMYFWQDYHTSGIKPFSVLNPEVHGVEMSYN